MLPQWSSEGRIVSCWPKRWIASKQANQFTVLKLKKARWSRQLICIIMWIDTRNIVARTYIYI